MRWWALRRLWARGPLGRLAATCMCAALVLPLAAPLARPILVAAQTHTGGERTLQELGFGDQTARTMFGALSFFFRIPRGTAPQPGSRLVLSYSHSPLLVPDRSTMTVTANGQSLTSVFLTPETRSGGQVSVALPTERFTGNGYFIQVQFAMRLTRDECEENQNPALWATVHGSSRVSLVLAPSASAPPLEEAAGLFAPTRREPVALIIPPAPVPEELEAAGLVAYQVGRWAAASGDDPAILVSTETQVPAGTPVIRVGTAAAVGMPPRYGELAWNGRAIGAPGGQVPEEMGVLATGLTESVAPELLVTGARPPGVLDAARALTSPERRALLAGSHSVLTQQPALAAPREPWLEGAASFAQLDVERREVVGPGLHTIDLRFERPAGWEIKEGAALELHLQVSPALRRETSWVAVSVEGHDAGTQRLGIGAPPTPESSGTIGAGTVQRVRFPLPHDRLNAGLEQRPRRGLSLQVRLFLDVPQVGCTSASPFSAWAAVLPASAWYLPHDVSRSLDLGRFPHPALDGPTSIVLPAQPTAEELAAGLRLAAAVGRWNAVPRSDSPRLITADRFGQAERQQHLLLVGGPDRNSASAEATRTAAGLFRPVLPAALKLAAGERSSSLRIGRSPFNRDRVVLVVFGEGGALASAVGALARADLFGRIQGQAVAVVDDVPAQSAESAAGRPPVPESLGPRVVVPLSQRLQYWQIAGAVLLGVFLSVLALVIRARRRAPRR